MSAWPALVLIFLAIQPIQNSDETWNGIQGAIGNADPCPPLIKIGILEFDLFEVQTLEVEILSEAAGFFWTCLALSYFSSSPLLTTETDMDMGRF